MKHRVDIRDRLMLSTVRLGNLIIIACRLLAAAIGLQEYGF